MLLTLFREFLNICLFRRAPQDLPASQPLLAVALAAAAAGSLIIAASSLPLAWALFSAVLEMLFMCGAIYMMLYMQGRTKRWLQTVTAVAGTNAVLVIISLPLLAWLLLAQSRETAPTLPSLLFFGLVIWNVMILGHIFRHALSTLMPFGVLIALFYYAASVAFINWLIPVANG